MFGAMFINMVDKAYASTSSHVANLSISTASGLGKVLDM